MRRFLVAVAVLIGLAVAYVLAHWALIETGNEVAVLRTENDDGSWLESRLWIVDDGPVAWLHGDVRSRWERNLAARPVVQVTRRRDAALPRHAGAGTPPEDPRAAAREVRHRGSLGPLRGRGPRDDDAGSPRGAAGGGVDVRRAAICVALVTLGHASGAFAADAELLVHFDLDRQP
jgi:hypothetical protein